MSRNQNIVLEGINRIFSEALSAGTEEELGRLCLAVAEDVTESAFSFLGEINEATNRVDDVSISERGWRHFTMDDPRFPEGKVPGGFEIHGIYGRVLRDGRGLIANDPTAHPDRIGIPTGHPPLKAFLGVPLKVGAKTVGMVGLGNRESGYRPEDMEAAEALAPAILQALLNKRTETRTRKSEARFRALVTTGAQAIYRMSPDWQQMYELRGENILADTEEPVDNWRDKYHLPEDRPIIDAAIARAILSKQMFELEHRVRKADGTIGWVLSRAVPMLGRNGEVTEWFGAARDITDRKLAERSLSEAKIILAETQKATGLGWWEWSVDTGAQAWSDTNYRLHDIDAASGPVTYENWLGSLHPEDRDRATAAARAITEDGTPYDMDYRVVHRDGTIRWLTGRGMLVKDSVTGARRVLGLNLDITERKNAEEALRRNEVRFRSFVEVTNEWTWVTDTAGQVVEALPGLTAFTGMSFEQIKGTGWIAALHPDDVKRTEEAWHQAVSAKTPYETEYRMRRHDGAERWMLARGTPIRDDTGNVIEWVGTVLDITERRAAEQALTHTRNMLTEAQKIAHLGSFEYVVATGTTIWSEEQYRTYGLDPARPSPTYDQLLAKYIHPEDAALFRETFAKASQSLTLFECEYRIVRPDGGIRWLHSRAHPYFGKSGALERYLGTSLDITERKAAEIALIRANRLIQVRNLSNMALLRAETEASYLTTACQIIVDVCGHATAWVGYAEPGCDKRVVPIAAAGQHALVLNGIRVSWSPDTAFGRGPMGIAIRTGRPAGSPDILADSRLVPWHDRARGFGFQSMVSLPFRVEDQTTGAFSIYATELNAFPDDEIELLTQIAADLADGIALLRLRAAHARAVQALRESEARLRLFIEHAPTALAMFDHDMRYLAVSRRWIGDYRLDARDIIGRSHYEIFPDLPERWKVVHRRCLAGAIERNDEEAFPREDGKIDWVRWECRPWFTEGDAIGGIIILSEVITEMVESRNALDEVHRQLHESREMLLLALSSADMGVWTANPMTGKMTANPKTQSLFGLASDAADTLAAALAAVHDDDRGCVEEAMRLAIDQSQSFAVEFRTQTAPQHERWLSARARWLPGLTAETSRMIGVVYDITEMKETEANLKAARDQAEAANKAKSIFISNMSHELRTPLGAILGFTQLLEMAGDDAIRADWKRYIEHILKNGRHLLALVNDLLDLAKLDAGQVALSIEPIAIVDLLDQLESGLLPLAEAAGIAVATEMANGLPMVLADRTRINQVLLNLGSNAVKYNRPGGAVVIGVERLDQGWIRLTFTDSGLGIPEARQAEVFEPLNRLGRETGAIEGTGIGLALSRRLMDLMGGRVGFASRPGVGSRFWTDLPVFRSETGDIDDPEDAPNDKEEKFAVIGAPARRTRTILYVDDSIMALDLMKAITGGLPATSLLTATSAEEGLELARRHRLDLILMDINLPGMNGFEALRMLRKSPATSHVPVFAITAAATPSDVTKGHALGFNQYMTKPFDVRELRNAITMALTEPECLTERKPWDRFP